MTSASFFCDRSIHLGSNRSTSSAISSPYGADATGRLSAVRAARSPCPIGELAREMTAMIDAMTFALAMLGLLSAIPVAFLAIQIGGAFLPTRRGRPPAATSCPRFTVIMPAQDQFYGFRCGSVRDPFGHEWMLQREIEKVAPEEMQRRWDAMLEDCSQ